MTLEPNFSVFLPGIHVDLIVLDEDVVEVTDWYRWFNCPETTRHLQKHYYPNTRAGQREYAAALRSDRSRVQLGIVAKDAGTMIGVVTLQNIDLINRNAEFTVVIGEAEGRKLIYAQEAAQLIIDHGFKTFNLHKIYCGYIASLASWGLFLKKRFGFRDEGVWREHVFKDGQYTDVYRLGLLKSDYLSGADDAGQGEEVNVDQPAGERLPAC